MTGPDPRAPVVRVLGIRHHGPGSARSLLRALEELRPDAVLVEGPGDADPLLAAAVSPAMQPPVALLGYAADDPGTAVFWPFAVYSPEWQALTWALRERVPVRFCDLPAAVSLAMADRDGHPPGRTRHRDPLAELATAAGHDDPERWWDDLVESRLDGTSPFAVLLEAMAELRRDAAAGEEVREAWMRQSLRRTLREGHRRVAVVCGAWHAPALAAPLPPAAPDARLLRGLPRRRVRLTWVPWSHSRLAAGTGYGAGVASPGWYHHLWTAPDRPVTRWLTSVAHALRERDLPVSTAHVIDAVRLADGLAGMRGRPLPGLAEVDEATRAVLCGGEDALARFVTEHLVVGEALGAVPDDVPTVPLEADLARACRSLRLRRDPEPRSLHLDLRRPLDLARSRLLHRLALLDLGWAVPGTADVRSTGTFRETWRLEWRPELTVAVVGASVWGTTVGTAAARRVVDAAASAGLGRLTAMLGSCLDADLPDAWTALLEAVERRAASDVDVVHLMEALPALARAQRYGDVRGTDGTALTRVAATMLVRVCAGLPQAVAGLDDDGARALRARLDAVHSAVGLLADAGVPDAALAGPAVRERWLDALAALADRPDVHGLVAGRVVRVLRDAGRLTDAPARLERALSGAVAAPRKAAWVDGFLADGVLLLAHDADLLRLLDDWVTGLSAEDFLDVLPLVRRTCGSSTPAERRAVAAAVRTAADRVGGTAAAGAGGAADTDRDDARARAALGAVAALLGVAVPDP